MFTKAQLLEQIKALKENEPEECKNKSWVIYTTQEEYKHINLQPIIRIGTWMNFTIDWATFEELSEEYK
jgi:hypothetical protein